MTAHLQKPSGGEAMAQFLSGAWRSSPPPLLLDEGALARITPFLLQSGAGALASHRLGKSIQSACARELRQAYRLHTLQASIHELNVQQIASVLESAGVEYVVIKGWTVARLYPEPGLRPYGDVDLAIAPGQLERARRALATDKGNHGVVDLHEGVPDLHDRTWPQIVSRTQVVEVGTARIRILSDEDQLRLLCLHLLRHGAWRPLWLCDVCVAVETATPQFDWDYLVSGRPRLSAWVKSGIGLAHRLLGARLDCATVKKWGSQLPRWLIQSVLNQWSQARRGDSHDRDTQPMASYLAKPLQLWHGLRCRWPNRIEAAIKMRAYPNTPLPLWLFQLAATLKRGTGFVRQMANPKSKESHSTAGIQVHDLTLQ